MTMDKGFVFWKSNKNWYRINEEKDCYELTEEAPQKAVDNFIEYLKLMEQAKKDAAKGIFRH